ncbi:hypothetical protein LUZ61_013750 [Rhynchospora tenuis]|uniref:BED-type domain-containing protein n=1 Tax=Rhynchospora tenuis TaxID=198213 RepID=A0AAD5W9R9_9POAL|nr:hypothetical protein LUZ61_013750 [Rhynchospora tenuis]
MNIVQFEDSNSRSKKGKENAQDRPSNKRSKVWHEFDETEQPDGSKKAKCSHCGKKLGCHSKNGTSHLRRHLDTYCQRKRAKNAVSDCPEHENNELFFFEENENNELNEYLENHLGYDLHNDQELSRYRDLAYDQQKNRELFVKMVIDNKTMLKHVENPFLKEFALSLQPLYSPVDWRTVGKDCLTFYENEKAELKDKLSKLTSRVSFSLMGNKPYWWSFSYCVSVHFINNNFKLEKIVVGFIEDKLGSIDKNFLNEWTFGKGFLAFTCDEYESYDFSTGKFAIEKFRLYWDETLYGNKLIFVRCILHCLKMIAAIFSTDIFTITFCVEKTLKELMKNHEQMSFFNQIALEHNLTPKTEFNIFDDRGLGPNFNMFHDAYTYKKVLLALGNTSIQWDVVDEVVGLLNPINDIVVMLSSSECPTINLLVKLVLRVKDVMSKASPVLSSTKAAINKSVAKLEKYLASCNELIYFASLLDPQLKSRFLEHWNGKGMPDKNKILQRFQKLYVIYQNESTEVSNNPKFSEQRLELKKYLVSKLADETDENFDVLGWWKNNELEYPILSRMARDILAIPIICSLTSGTEPLEEILNEFSKSRISSEMSKVLVCCNNWLRSQREKENDLCATIKSGNADPKLHINYQGVRVAQGNNFTNAPEKCRELLVNMVISSRMSFNLLKSSSFIEWARNLQPMYDPNVVSIERDLLGFYQIDRGMLPSFSDKKLARISFSVRFRNKYPLFESDKYAHSYATAHYIDSDFNLLTTIIGIKEVISEDPDDDSVVDHRFDGLRVAEQLERFIQNRGLDKNVLAFTISKSGGEFFHEISFRSGKISLECSIIGLFYELSKNTLSFFYKEYYCIRKMIEFVGENTYVMQTFDQLALEYKIPPKSDFRFDDDNGWDSLFNVVHDALPYRDVFAALERKTNFPPWVETLSRERWDNLECHVKLWKPIYKAPIVLSSFKYPTSHLFLRIVFEIPDVISYSCTDLRMNSDHDVILDCLNNLVAFIDKFLKKCNKILLIASVLDPPIQICLLKTLL